MIEEGLISGNAKIFKDDKQIATFFIKGNTEGEGFMDGADLLIVIKILSGERTPTDLELIAADVDNDGDVDVNDKNIILNNFSIPELMKYQNVEVTKLPKVIYSKE